MSNKAPDGYEYLKDEIDRIGPNWVKKENGLLVECTNNNNWSAI